jgi:peptide/nickel transport system substrate-binding protein
MKFSSESGRNLVDRFLHLIESVAASDKLLLRISFFAVIFAGIWVLISLNSKYLEVTPTYGGSFTEGILGTPRYINPALAITRADQDVTALVYSGLMKIDPNGELVNDLAEEIKISEDGLTYDITIRKDIKFHDGISLTAKDVVYTIQLIQDPDLKSPLRGNWSDVSVVETDEYGLRVTLEDAYAPFIENFTLGIMPSHAWSTLSIDKLPFSQLNTEPVGSGPFKISKAERDTSGLINHYTLTAFDDYIHSTKISEIELNFFEDVEKLMTALKESRIDATAYVPQASTTDLLSDKFNLIEEPLPRTFGIFFNQNRSPVLRERPVREALTLALNRDTLIESAFYGHSVPITGPIPFQTSSLELGDSIEDTNKSESDLDKAINILKNDGWKKDSLGHWEKQIDKDNVTLSVTLRTSNAPLFISLSTLIQEQWEELGVDVTVEQFEQTGLIQSVIRPRDYQALLFGHDISRSYDLYPIWHSSQQSDPGLNIAQYANVSVDALLESARSEQNNEIRLETLRKAGEIISKEMPAIFIAQPTLTYIVDKNISVTKMDHLGRPADRFSNVSDWHTESDSVWKIFRNDDI